MGNSQTVQPIRNPSFFALNFPLSTFYDEMDVIYSIDEIASILKDGINKDLLKRIEAKSQYVMKFHFDGKPFAPLTCTNEVALLHLMLCRILRVLLSHGWVMKAATEFSHLSKSTTYIFERAATKPEQEVPVIAVSLHKKNKLYLLNGDSDLWQIVKSVIKENWPKGISQEKKLRGNNYKVKLDEWPWLVGKCAPPLAHSRLLILNLISSFHDYGLAVYGSGHPETDAYAIDAIYFTRHEKLEPLGPIFMLGLLRDDLIYLVKASSDIVDIVRHCIKSVWGPGIKEEKEVYMTRVFKLNMSPWCARQLGALQARFLIVRLLEDLFHAGAKIHCTLDLCYNVDDVSCFVMREHQQQAATFMAISMHEKRSDGKIRLINVPPDTLERLRECIRRSSSGDKIRGDKEKYNGFPEFTFPCEISSSIPIFLIILDEMKNLGWNLVSSADLSATHKMRRQQNRSSKPVAFPADCHTLIFEREIRPQEPDTMWSSQNEDKGACGGFTHSSTINEREKNPQEPDKMCSSQIEHKGDCGDSVASDSSNS